MTSTEEAKELNKNVPVQQLLKQQVVYHGWVRRKGAMQVVGEKIEGTLKLGRALSQRLPWQQRYAVLHEGKLYIYNDEMAAKAQKVLRLSDFKSFTSLVNDEVLTKDVPWPFQLERQDGRENLKCEFFAVTSQEELKKWQNAFDIELRAVNTKRPAFDTMNSIDSDDGEYTNPDEYGGEYTDMSGESLPAALATNSRPLPSIPPATSGSRPVPAPPSQKTGDASPTDKTNTGSRPVSVSARQKTEVESPTDKTNAAVKPPLAVRKPREAEPSPSSKPAPVVPRKPAVPLPSSKPAVSPTGRIAAVQPRLSLSQPKPEPVDLKKTNSNTDDLIYEVGSVVDDAMWNGTAEDAQKFLQNGSYPDGSYLIRKASDGHGYSLLAICQGTPCKFKIYEDLAKNTCKMATYTCQSLEELIAHFTETNLPNKTTPLTLPYAQLQK